MANYFEITGYWKDDISDKFEGYIVSDMDDSPLDSEPYMEEHIFFFGLSEEDLKEAIRLKEDTAHDYVITSYVKLEPKQK